MEDHLLGVWKASRVRQLKDLALGELIVLRDRYGLSMDPRDEYDLAHEIAKEELRRIREGSNPSPVPEDTANTAYVKGELGPDFRPNQELRVEMYDYLAAKFGVETVNALEFPWGGHQDLNIGAMQDMVLDHYPAADVAGFPFQDADDGEPSLTAREWLEEMERRLLGSQNPTVGEHWHNKILLNVDPREMKTESADFIINSVLPEVLRHFLSKNADYGDQHRTGLGLRAEFVGLHRKFAKLKNYFWDSKVMNHENGQEMLFDTIGAILLMLDLMAQEAVEPMSDPAAY